MAIICSVNSEVPESLFIQKKFFSDLVTDCFQTSILDKAQTASIPEKSWLNDNIIQTKIIMTIIDAWNRDGGRETIIADLYCSDWYYLIFLNVFVTYCWVTNYPEFSGLKQHIIS